MDEEPKVNFNHPFLSILLFFKKMSFSDSQVFGSKWGKTINQLYH